MRKKNITLLFALFFSLSLSSQIQLDSLLFRTGENNFLLNYKFKYENNRITDYTIVVDPDDVNDSYTNCIKYNSAGNFDKFIFTNGEAIWKFTYDVTNTLDSINIFENYSSQEELVYSYVYDIENDRIKEIQSFIVYSGTDFELDAVDKYSYNSNDLIKSIESYISYENNELIYEKSKKYNYDENNRLSFLDYSFSEDSIIIYRDSFNFLPNGNLESSYIKYLDQYGSGNLILTSKTTYNSDETVSFNNIANPLEVWEIFNHQNYDDFKVHSLALLYGNKIIDEFTESTTNYKATWYYSMITGTDETRIQVTPISIFPNPTMNEVKVKTDEVLVNCIIYDMQGAIVSEGTFSDNRIDVSALIPGQYTLVSISKDKKHYFSNLIKQ